MQCIYDSEGSSDKAEIYKMRLATNQIAENVFKSDIFKETEVMQEKVIMMIGDTGVGKTTLINRMINYIFGVNYDDTFRFQLIDDIEVSQTKTQTTDIHKYTIHHEKIPYKISIIDTPGICSTEDKKDCKTIERFRYFYESGAVEVINALCIIEKYSTTRFTENQAYILQTIAQMFGKDVGEAIVIMATSCNDIFDDTATLKPPPVLQFCKQLEIPFKTHYLFNNKNIFAKPLNTKSLNEQIETAFWNASINSFKSFFEMLETTTPISLKLTKNILQKKYNIENVQLPQLVNTLKTNIHEIETLEQDRRKFQEMIENSETSEYTVSIDVVKRELDEIPEPNKLCTRCKKCNTVCHSPCNIREDNYIYTSLIWCSAMTWLNPFNIHCTQCIGECSWKDHEQIPWKRKTITDEDLGIIRSLKRHILPENIHEIAKKTCEESMVSAYHKVVKDFKEIQNGIDFINKNTLSKNPTTIKEYIDKAIESEEETKEDGYEQRICCLKKLAEIKDEAISSNDVQLVIAFIQNGQRKYM